MKKNKTPLSGKALIDAVLPVYQSMLPPETYTKLIEELEKPLNSAIRFNPLKTNPVTAIKDLSQRYGWETQPIPFCPTGWWVKSAQIEPSRTHEHRSGHFYIQDAASMLPSELFDLGEQKPRLILDMAASPGGKTTHLISRTGDKDLVLANDSSRSRVTALRLSLQTWGSLNNAVTCFPGESFAQWYPETFDAILLDAPCSMENLRNTDSHPMRPISSHERSNLAARQLHLLESAVMAARVGGQIVYSTCTLSVEENEAVLDNLLSKYPQVVEIKSAGEQLTRETAPLLQDGTKKFNPEISNAIRLWPHAYGTSGFFAALLIKKDRVVGEKSNPPQVPQKTAWLSPLSVNQTSCLAKYFQENFYFPLEVILEKYHCIPMQRGTDVFAIPQRFLEYFGRFPVQSLGLQVGEIHPRGFLPSHEWVSRFFADFTRSRYILPDTQIAAWLRGGDIRQKEVIGAEPRSILILVNAQGNYLGRGRLLTDRIKNLIPRRLVLQ